MAVEVQAAQFEAQQAPESGGPPMCKVCHIHHERSHATTCAKSAKPESVPRSFVGSRPVRGDAPGLACRGKL